MILAIRTEAPDATIALVDGGTVADTHSWHAHRTLARDLLKVIQDRLNSQGKEWKDISGVILFKGPGSFTGLRIGASVANTIAFSQKLSIVGVSGDDWLNDGIKRLGKNEDDKFVQPFYGSEAHITKPKK